jgi:hypothetical protein
MNPPQVTFELPGINAAAINARKASKRRSDSQLVTMAMEFDKASKLESEKRDALRPVVSAKRTLEAEIVENLVAAGHRGFSTSDGMRVQLIERRMDAPDQREVKEGLEAAGFSLEQIQQIKEVYARSKRVKYDVQVIVPPSDGASQSQSQQNPPGVVGGIVAAIQGGGVAA